MDVRRRNDSSWRRYSVQKDFSVLIPILLLAALFRFTHLNESGLWLDEVYYTIIAKQPIWDQIFHPIQAVSQLYGNDPILSAIPFSLSAKLGNENFFARLPAVIFGVLSVAAIYRAGREFFGNVVGLVAAFLLATSGFHVLYSQEARSYSQLLFFCLLSFWFLYCSTTKPKFSNWLLYTIATAAGVSSNYAMVFAFPAQGLFLTFYTLSLSFDNNAWHPNFHGQGKRIIKLWGYFSLSLAAVVLIRLPWIETLRYSVDHNAVRGSDALNFWPNIAIFFSDLMGNNSIAETIFLLLCAIGLAAVLIRFPKPGVLLTLWAILAVPVTILSIWLVGHFFHPRFVIWAVPAFALAAACGIVMLSDVVQYLIQGRGGLISNIPAKTIRSGAMVFLIAPLLITNYGTIQHLLETQHHRPRGRLQAAAQLVASQAKTNETVITIGLPASHIQFFTERERQDLLFLDDTTFVEQHSIQSLPLTLKGRWYVIHNAYSPPNIPENWKNTLQYSEFHDIVLVHLSDVCQLKSCLANTRVLLTEISNVNPGSPLETAVNNIIAGLDQLEF